ncbi:hypothetical protein HN51_065244 [Arachis hypogaea]
MLASNNKSRSHALQQHLSYGNREGGDAQQQQHEDWWNEAKHQLLFSLPMILTNSFYYLITLVSVMLVGLLGKLQLAGSALANSWFGATGVSSSHVNHTTLSYLIWFS